VDVVEIVDVEEAEAAEGVGIRLLLCRTRMLPSKWPGAHRQYKFCILDVSCCNVQRVLQFRDIRSSWLTLIRLPVPNSIMSLNSPFVGEIDMHQSI